MNRTGCNESMNPRPFCILHGLPCRLNILLIAPRQPTNHRHVTVLVNEVPNFFGDHLHGLEVVFRRRREPGLDYVHAELGQLSSNVELLFGGEGGAGGLLAVAEGGVEDADIVGVGDAIGDILGTASGARVRVLRAENAGFGVGFRGGAEIGSGNWTVWPGVVVGQM